AGAANTELDVSVIFGAIVGDRIFDELDHVIERDRRLRRVDDGFEFGFEAHASDWLLIRKLVSCIIAIPRCGMARSLPSSFVAKKMAPQDDKSFPVVADGGLRGHDGVESYVLSNQNFAEHAVLAQLDGLHANQFEQRQKNADQRLTRFDIAQELFQPKRPVFERQAPLQVFDHLSDGDSFLINLDHRGGARAIQDLLKSFDQVDDVGGDLGSVPSASMKSLIAGLERTASSICCFCMSICAADLNFSCSMRRLTSSLRGSSCYSEVAAGSRGRSIFDLI